MAKVATVVPRWIELVAAFVVAPALLALGPRWLVTVAILASGGLCALALSFDPTFARRDLVDLAAARPGLRRVLLRTAVVWLGLLVLTLAASPGTLFGFPRARPTVWLAVMILYPLSA